MTRALLILATVLFAILGCGGHGSSDHATRSGAVTLTVRWPVSRDIPPATRSLRVSATTLVKGDSGAKEEDKVVGERVVTRPEDEAVSTVHLEDLPSVEVRIKVFAYGSTDGSGSPIAVGTKDVTIASGESTTVTIELHADVASIEADPSSVSVGGGQTTTLVVQAKDLNGAPTLISDSRWVFTSSNPSLFSVTKRSSPNGHIADVTGIAEGSGFIHVEDSQTGVFLDVPVTVENTVDRCPFFRITVPGDTKTTRSFSGVSASYPDGGGAIGGNCSLSLTAFAGTVSAESVLHYFVEAPNNPGPHTVKFVWRGTATIEGGSVNITLSVNGISQTFTKGTTDEDVPVLLEVPVIVKNGDFVKVEFSASATSTSGTDNVNPRGTLEIQDQPEDVSIFAETCS